MSKLDEIKAEKEKEIEHLQIPLLSSKKKRTLFSEMLKKPGISVIAEVKRASPSSGMIALIDDPVALASEYLEGGAEAISVLTDSTYFKGTLSDLRRVADRHFGVPVLRKDFIIDKCQIYEAIESGASAVLLIVALLKERTADLLKICHDAGIEALVEVHNLEETRLAIAAGAKIVGVNNRNLETFEVDLTVAERVIKYLPEDVIKVAESGIRNSEDVERMYRCGYDAVLVGEALVRASSSKEMVQAMKRVGYE